MVSTTVYLLALVLTSLMAAVGKPQIYLQRSRTRASSAVKVRKAMHKIPRWRSLGVNPWESSGKYEGDMLVANLAELKSVIKDSNRTWPDTSIPFRIDQSYFLEEEVKKILMALREFNTFTCVSLRLAKETDEDYILIKGKRGGCWSAVGRVGGEQELNLAPEACLDKEAFIYHEIMHAIGLVHEHNLPGREEHIRVYPENSVNKDFFQQLKQEEVIDYRIPYDMGSIMHPSRKAFTKNNQSTIETRDEFAVIGQARRLSENDKKKVKIHYRCIPPPPLPPTTTTSPEET